jgi:hypothetical protein
MRITSAQLETDRMLERVETEKARMISMQHRARGEHLRIDQRVPREQTMEVPAVPVRPLHHRRDAEAAA